MHFGTTPSFLDSRSPLIVPIDPNHRETKSRNEIEKRNRETNEFRLGTNAETQFPGDVHETATHLSGCDRLPTKQSIVGISKMPEEGSARQ